MTAGATTGALLRTVSPQRRTQVLTVYQHLPHYRGEVFAELQATPGMDWVFAADLQSADGSIPTIPPGRFTSFSRLRNHWYGPVLWQSGLVSLVLRKRYDAVVFLGDAAYASSWLAALICRARGSKVAFWTIGWHRPETGLRRRVRLGFYRLAHTLLVYGHTGKRIGASLGYPADRMTVVGNSTSSHVVHVHEPQPLQASLPAPGGDVVTAVVRLTELKALHLLIRAAGVLRTRGRPVIVVLAGGGPESEALRSLAGSEGVDLRLLGPVYSTPALDAIYACTAVTVVPLNAGLTCIQSLSYGRPVITTDDPYQWAPESEAIRPGVTGGLYADGSVESLADVIEDWLARVRADGPAVAAACKREVAMRWTPAAQAAAISAAVSELVGAEPVSA